MVIVIFDDCTMFRPKIADHHVQIVTNNSRDETLQTCGTAIAEEYHDLFLEAMHCLAAPIPEKPRERFYTKSRWKGTKEHIYFVRVDEEGLEIVTEQVWRRVRKQLSKPKQGPVKRLRFLTADRCDHNRGRSWDRKAA